METRNYWEENGHSVKYDNYNNSNDDGFGRVGGEQLSFAPPSEDEAEYPPGAYLKKGKVSRQDPMSHRIIEKRRRDRMNNCLADLSRLIPPEYLKKGRGRVEKTEIIEMAIRHLKYLQDQVNVTDRQSGEEHFRAGYQEAVGEMLRFLSEVQGYRPGEGLCVQLASHLQRHCDAVTKGELLVREKPHSHPASSSETNSSSSSSHGFMMKSGVMAQAPPPGPPPFVEPYEQERLQDSAYAMDCERGTDLSLCSLLPAEGEAQPEEEPLPLDGRRQREPTLRAVRKPDHGEDYLHSYKFKNSIERRFSRSQDNVASDALARVGNGKLFSHKRRRTAKIVSSTSTSASVSTEDAPDTSTQDTSSESTPHRHYDKPSAHAQYVPVFALNALGKYYVPMSVEYSCLSRYLSPYDLLDSRAVHSAAPLHPVTIHVNFQPCVKYHVKSEPNDREWRPAS